MVTLMGDNAPSKGVKFCRFDSSVVSAKLIDFNVVMCTAPSSDKANIIDLSVSYNMQEFHYSVSFIYEAVTDVISEIMLSEIDLSPQCWQTSSSLQPAEYDSSVWTTRENFGIGRYLS